jgi:regulatory protein
VRKVSEKSLSNVALFYLRKHSASRKGLTQFLERKVKLKLRGKDDAAELQGAKALIETVVARMMQSGYVDDARMAESKSASLQRQGKSSRVIQLKLREKGIEPALAAKSAITTPEQEFESACTLVKRKRLGVDPERKQKDFAVLMRAGFNSDLARRALLTAEVKVELAEEEEFFDEMGETNVIPFSSRSGVSGGAEGGGQVLAFPARAVAPARAAFAKPGSAPVSELEQAQLLVRKKRLGVDPARRQKDLAVLMRAGFRYDLAKQALED